MDKKINYCFKAAVLSQLNSPLELKNITAKELKVGQVLVKNIVSGICGAQLHEIKGHKGNANFLPHLLGHEGCGIVEEIGHGVSKVKPGDKVVMHWRQGSGIDSDFPSYYLGEKKISSGKVTTLSEYSIVSENRITKVPIDVSPEFCAILGCALTTALGVVDNEIDIKLGESALVIGCGGVGLNLIQGLKMKNAYPIYSLDLNKSKESLCKELGADMLLTNLADLQNKIDIIIDTTGVPELISNAISKLSDTGRMILIGQTSPNSCINIMNAVTLFNGKGQTIKATQGGQTNPDQDIPRYIKLFKNGNIKIDSLITDRFKLNEINKAFDLLKTGNAGRIMINIAEGNL
jgi:Zn-dependent alcohol dehydrogenase